MVKLTLKGLHTIVHGNLSSAIFLSHLNIRDIKGYPWTYFDNF